MKGLDTLMASIRDMRDDDVSSGAATHADLLLYAPCPVKLVVKDRIEAIVRDYAARGEQIVAKIPMGCTSVDPYDPVYMETDPARLPSVIASIGFGDFWKREFVERFVHTGLFESVLPERVSPLYEQAGMIDPKGCYTVYGATPYIFLVDTKSLGDLPIPRTWADLLHPRYKGEIVMCGDGDDMADAVVLNLYKDFGLEGMQRLAENTRGLMHSSKMAKIGGSTDKEARAIFIIPCFFAESTKQPEHVRVVWPEDGAAASPLYFLAKKSERRRLTELLRFFTHGFGEIESAAWFAPLDGSRPSRLPEGARLKWVGWEFMENNDVNRLRDELNVAFREMQRTLS